MKHELRELYKSDCHLISKSFEDQGWHKPVSQYDKYWEDQNSGLRDVIVATIGDQFVGYLTIVWQSKYPPFRKAGIPEIVDFNVLMKYQRQGVGSRLMEEAERRIAKVCQYAGIGVGITEDYGAAQILYVKRNYIPDGRGLNKNHQMIEYGDEITVNDDLAIYSIKQL